MYIHAYIQTSVCCSMVTCCACYFVFDPNCTCRRVCENAVTVDDLVQALHLVFSTCSSDEHPLFKSTYMNFQLDNTISYKTNTGIGGERSEPIIPDVHATLL